jgi:hypothetical protein
MLVRLRDRLDAWLLLLRHCSQPEGERGLADLVQETRHVREWADETLSAMALLDGAMEWDRARQRNAPK